MDELYDADICISNTDKGPVIEAQKAIVIDLSDQVSPLTPAYLDEVRASSKGLHESVIRASEFIQPTLPSGLCSANAASLIGGISGIAESVKPLSVMKAVEGITTVSDMLPDLVASMPTFTDVLTNPSDTAAGIGGLTDQLIASLPEPPALAADFGTAVKVAIPDPVPFVAPVPVVESIGKVQGVNTLDDSSQQFFSANAEIAGDMQSLTSATTDTIKSAFTEIIAPVTESLRKISEEISAAISPIVKIGNYIRDLFVSINVPDFGAEGSDMTGDPITVAVFDTAIDFSHPDLKDVAYTFTPEDQQLLQCDEHGYNGLWDAEDEKLSYSPGGDHGTHCAGIIGASWDGHGISGVASNVKTYIHTDWVCGRNHISG